MQIIVVFLASLFMWGFSSAAHAAIDRCREEPFIVDSQADEAVIESGLYDCPGRTVYLKSHTVSDLPNLKIRAGKITVEAPVYNTGNIELIAETGDITLPTKNSVLYSQNGTVGIIARKTNLIAYNAEIHAAQNITGWIMGDLRWAGGVIVTPEDIKFRIWHNVKLLPEDFRLILQGDDVAFKSENGDIEYNKIEADVTSFDTDARWQVRAHESRIFAQKVSFTGTMQVMIDGSLIITDQSSRFQVNQVCMANHQPCVEISRSEVHAATIVIKTPDKNGINDTILLCESEVVDNKPANPSINGDTRAPYGTNVYDTDAECILHDYASGARIE